MRLPLFACSVLTGLVGCMLFQVGGFMLLPVALDLWERAVDEARRQELTPAPAVPAS